MRKEKREKRKENQERRGRGASREKKRVEGLGEERIKNKEKRGTIGAILQ